jgi:hypothetical protein
LPFPQDPSLPGPESHACIDGTYVYLAQISRAVPGQRFEDGTYNITFEDLGERPLSQYLAVAGYNSFVDYDRGRKAQIEYADRTEPYYSSKIVTRNRYTETFFIERRHTLFLYKPNGTRQNQGSYFVRIKVIEHRDDIYLGNGGNVLLTWQEYKVVNYRYPPCEPPKPAIPPPEQCEKPMACCCSSSSELEEIQREQLKTDKEILKLLKEIHKGVGCPDLPASLPASLLADRSGQTSVDSLVKFFGWFTEQFDALAGQWPLEIEIEDTDPTQKGNQTKKVELPNIAEALAEIYGVSINSAIDSDTSINMLTRVLAEVVATKNSSLITQDHARASTAFFGYKGNPTPRKVQYSVNPTELETLDKLLQPSTQEIVGWENEENDTLVEILTKLMFSAGIIKSAFFRNNKTHGELSLRKNLVDLVKQYAQQGNENWDKFIEEINNPASAINQGDYAQPEIKDVSMKSNKDLVEGLDNLKI